MKCKDSNFWIGLGIGSVAGALAYHFSRTEKAKKAGRCHMPCHPQSKWRSQGVHQHC